MERNYTSRRMAIVDALVSELKEINGTGDYRVDLDQNVEGKTVFWDDISQFPIITVTPGTETREYQGGGYKDRYLAITVRAYVNEENAQRALETLIEDLETSLEKHSRLAYTDKNNKTQYTQQITIVSIETDEGLLEPYGIAEINAEVRY